MQRDNVVALTTLAGCFEYRYVKSSSLSSATIDCPGCHLALDAYITPEGATFPCGQCCGQFVFRDQLSTMLRGQEDLVASARPVGGVISKPRSCPMGCGLLSPRVVCNSKNQEIGQIQSCLRCQGTWFDAGVLQALQRQARPVTRPRIAPIEPPQEDLAEQKVLRADRAMEFAEPPTRSGLSWMFQFFTGLPLKGPNPVYGSPLFTYLFVLSCVVVFAFQQASSFQELGLTPARFFAGEDRWTILTSVFIHGSIFHLAGNMYFLWMFGTNVEDRIGKLNFVFLYLFTGVFAALSYAGLHPSSASPLGGASGAVSGVFAAYMVLFPSAYVTTPPYLITLFRRIDIRAMFYFPWWLLTQIFWLYMIPNARIAWEAHIGGFVAGVLIALVIKHMSRDHRVEALR